MGAWQTPFLHLSFSNCSGYTRKQLNTRALQLLLVLTCTRALHDKPSFHAHKTQSPTSTNASARANAEPTVLPRPICCWVHSALTDRGPWDLSPNSASSPLTRAVPHSGALACNRRPRRRAGRKRPACSCSRPFARPERTCRSFQTWGTHADIRMSLLPSSFPTRRHLTSWRLMSPCGKTAANCCQQPTPRSTQESL